MQQHAACSTGRAAFAACRPLPHTSAYHEVAFEVVDHDRACRPGQAGARGWVLLCRASADGCMNEQVAGMRVRQHEEGAALQPVACHRTGTCNMWRGEHPRRTSVDLSHVVLQPRCGANTVRSVEVKPSKHHQLVAIVQRVDVHAAAAVCGVVVYLHPSSAHTHACPHGVACASAGGHTLREARRKQPSAKSVTNEVPVR